MVGVIVDISAVATHIQLVRELRTGTWVPGKISRNAILLALVLAAVSIGMASSLALESTLAAYHSRVTRIHW